MGGNGACGVWYTDDMTVERALIEAPKNFALSQTDAQRSCPSKCFRDIVALYRCDTRSRDGKGRLFRDGLREHEDSGLPACGKLFVRWSKNVEIHNAKLLSKDAFWNSENVTVYDSVISGEYLGWNSKNLTLINCTIESLQGMCYIENLVMKNCKLVNTTLAFEYSTVDVEIQGGIDSVINPTSGVIRADSIGTLIMEPGR